MIDKFTLETSLRSQITPADLEHYHSVAEAGRILNIGRNRAYELVNSGDLLTVKVGSKNKVTDFAIKLFVIEKQLEAYDRRSQPMKAEEKNTAMGVDKPEYSFSIQGQIPYNNNMEELHSAP